MKFGKRIRTELPPHLLRGSVDYKYLKRIAKKIAREGGGHFHHPAHQRQAQEGTTEFFRLVEVEREKVAAFYYAREAWCFLALETTRGALFGLTRRASKERLNAANGEIARPAGILGRMQAGTGNAGVGQRHAAGELEGKFLEAKAGATVLLSESKDLVKFVDMNMSAFRKLLKKFDKWTNGSSGREYFLSMVQTQPWLDGSRAHGVLRMASAMADHLRGLRPALSLGPAAGGPSWADRIVYSVGSFDRPRLCPASVDEVSHMSSAGLKGCGGGTTGSGSGRANGNHEPFAGAELEDAAFRGTAMTSVAVREASSSPLRFLREFGAVVVVGVYSDEAHAALQGNDDAWGAFGPSECLEARCARVRPYADRVVVVDSPDPARVRETLLGAANSLVSEGEGSDLHSGNLSGSFDRGAGGGVGGGYRESVAPSFSPVKISNNCCFVICDRDLEAVKGPEEAKRVGYDMREAMETTMPVFLLPRLTWEWQSTANHNGRDGGEEVEEEE